MKKKEILENLEQIAEHLGVAVRYVELGNHPGGICKLFGRKFIFVNRSLDIDAQIELLLSKLKEFDLDGVFMLPEIRNLIFRDTKKYLESDTKSS